MFIIFTCANINANNCVSNFKLSKGRVTRGGFDIIGQVLNNSLQISADGPLFNAVINIVEKRGNVVLTNNITSLFPGSTYYIDLFNLEKGDYAVELNINESLYTTDLTIDDVQNN